MKVYLLIGQDDYEPSVVLGVYSTPDNAAAAEAAYRNSQPTRRLIDFDDYLTKAFELDGAAAP